MKSLISRIHPRTHIMAKIWFAAAAIAVSCILIVSLCLQVFLSNYYLKNALRRAQSNTEITASAFHASISDLVKLFVHTCGTDDFYDLMKQLRSASSSDYAVLNSSVQDVLNTLVYSNRMIDSALMTAKETGQTYLLPGQRLRSSTFSYTLRFSEEQFSNVTLLPMIDNPIRNRSQVLPLAFPISFMPQTEYPMISESAENSSHILFVLLQSSAVNSYLSTYSPDNTEGTLYLYSADGQLLNYSASAPEFQKARELVLSELLSESIKTQKKSGVIPCTRSYMVYQQVGSRGIYLINLIPSGLLLETRDTLLSYLFYTAIVSLVLVSLVTLFAAIYITKPITQLMNAVSSIKSGTYTSDYVLPQTDEIGQLSHEIDSMYHKIQQQIEELADERQETTNAKIRLFTEQINPHFLYNTLEYINMEVYNHHSENASFMIQKLGDFLRIGLNFGSDFSTISREIEHVQAYINIMNYRFQHQISFVWDIEEGLASYPILKVILQPLAENSIKHGFLLDGNQSYLAAPSIRIKAWKDGSSLFLSVSDNGIGIDVEKATRIMADTAAQKHVGLNNVYQRLKVCYPDSDITFSSIPYYQNTVLIKLPYTRDMH